MKMLCFFDWETRKPCLFSYLSGPNIKYPCMIHNSSRIFFNMIVSHLFQHKRLNNDLWKQDTQITESKTTLDMTISEYFIWSVKYWTFCASQKQKNHLCFLFSYIRNDFSPSLWKRIVLYVYEEKQVFLGVQELLLLYAWNKPLHIYFVHLALSRNSINSFDYSLDLFHKI